MTEKINIKHICMNIPKAELHIHIEGTFEPELVVKLAKKYNKNEFTNLEDLKQKYKFTCLKDFLDLYYACCDVLREEEDFQELMYEYLKKAYSQGLKYAEIFFDPQTHLNRNISFKTVINGLTRGIEQGEKEFNIKASLIMCFLRDLSEESALDTLKQSLEFRDMILGVGLDSNEINNPPEKFINVYSQAKDLGLKLVAHAGEECSIPTDYIYSALDNLKVQRIDHGVQVRKSKELQEKIIIEKIPLTMCPLSNLKLQVHKDLSESPLKVFYEKGIIVTINSDDPAYFGGYIGDNYLAVANTFNLQSKDIANLAKNSFTATFLSDEEKQKYIDLVDKFIKDNLA